MKKKLVCTATVRFTPSVIPASNFVAAARARMPVNPAGAGKGIEMILITVKTNRIATEGGRRTIPVIGSNTGQATRITRLGIANSKQSATFKTGRFAILA